MSEISSKSTLAGSGNLTTAALIGVIYATVSEFSGNIALNPLRPDVTFNIAIFVPALAAILFGKNTGGMSAGLGSAMIQFQEVFAGRAAFSDLPLEVLINTLANYLGGYLTGYLTPSKREFFPSTFKAAFFNIKQWKRIILNSMAAIVGMSMTSSFTIAYGSQIADQDQLVSGVPFFLENFFASTAVLIILIPVGLLLFDTLLVFLLRRGQIMDGKKRDLDYEVTEEGGAKVTSIKLPEHALMRGKWTPMKLKFKNTLEQATSYYIEAVSTGRVYPHQDRSKVLEQGEEWEQTFYVLTGKQDEVALRMQLTPTTGKAFKQELADDTTINITGSTLDPKNYSLGLGQFTGINFGVLGLSIIWNDIVTLFNDPTGFLNGLAADLSLLGFTAIAETVLMGLVLLAIFFYERRKKDEDKLLLSFSADQDAHGYQEIETKFITTILKYQRYAVPVLRGALVLSTIFGISYLGYEGFKLYTIEGYGINNDQKYNILLISAGILGLWVVALKLLDIIEALSEKGLPDWILKPGSVVINFKPKGQFKVNEPTEVHITAQNPTKLNGVRIVFESEDNISPPIIELHAAPNETVNFKIAVTPSKQEPREILLLAYPFFDEEGREIDFNEAEPYSTQEIEFQVQPQTMLGITKDQKNALMRFGGVGAVITAALSFAQSFLGDSADVSDLIETVKANAPYLAGLQAPFAYVYFYVKNKYLSGNSVNV